MKMKKRNRLPKITDRIKIRAYFNGTCAKTSYESKSLAKKAISQIEKSSNKRESNFEIVPYYCEKCRAYHIGHKNTINEMINNEKT